MESKIELRVLELLCSRLCHDLISPVMAVNNGMELMEDDSGDMSDDIRDLLAVSAAAAASRLQYYRIAYGLGGQNAAPVGLPEAGRLTRGLIEEGKIELDWPNGDTDASGLSREAMKLLLNLVLLGIESLPRGGRLRVEVAPSGFAVAAEGEGAQLREESAAAMSGAADIEALTARSVQGYFVNLLAGLLGTETAVSAPAAGSVTLSVRLPA